MTRTSAGCENRDRMKTSGPEIYASGPFPLVNGGLAGACCGPGGSLRIQLLRGDLRRNARLTLRTLIAILDLRVDLASLFRFALGGVHVRELKLCEVRRHGGGVALGELLVQRDGLPLAAGLRVELRERVFAEGGGIPVEAGSDLLQGFFGLAVLPGFHVGEAAEVKGILAGLGHTVLVRCLG